MKLSERTLTIFKNFAAINPNLLIHPGSKLDTWIATYSVMAETKVEEDFPCEFGIFNLVEFLGVYSLFSKPDLTFTATDVTIQEGKSKIRYVAADKSMLVYPNKALKMPTPEVTFQLGNTQLAQVLKASSALSVGDLAIIGDGKKVILKVYDKKNPSSNEHTLDLGVKNVAKFDVKFRIENFKQLPDDYEVSISSKLISRFVGKNNAVTYYIAPEKESVFE
jgi:hypothetical protein